jgi:hypothetical protein
MKLPSTDTRIVSFAAYIVLLNIINKHSHYTLLPLYLNY